VLYNKKKPTKINYLLNLNAHHSHSSIHAAECFLVCLEFFEAKSAQQSCCCEFGDKSQAWPLFYLLSQKKAFWHGQKMYEQILDDLPKIRSQKEKCELPTYTGQVEK